MLPSDHFVFFFFSSRRRHTRLQGDWSSDVCSSDLNIPFQTVRLVAATHDDVVTVHIRPSFEPNGVDARIPLRRPLVLATLTPKRIDGYGLETATLTIVGSAGVPKESLAVSLDAERGALGALRGGGGAERPGRSRGLGPGRESPGGARYDPLRLRGRGVRDRLPGRSLRADAARGEGGSRGPLARRRQRTLIPVRPTGSRH